MIANDFFARIAILDPSLLTILSNIPHLDCVSNMFDNVPFEERCNQNEVLLLLGVKKTACRALSFSFPPRIVPLPKMDCKFHEIPLRSKNAFHLYGMNV